MKPVDRVPLGDVLIAADAVTQAQLDQALAEQSSWGGRLGQNLVSLGFITEATLAAAIARQLGLETVELDRLTLSPDVIQLLRLGVAERYGMIPLEVREGPRRLLVACIDPTNAAGLLEARTSSGMHVEPRVASASAVDRAIRRYYYGETPAVGAAGADPRLNLTRATVEQRPAPAPEVTQRLAQLEHDVAELKRLVTALMAR